MAITQYSLGNYYFITLSRADSPMMPPALASDQIDIIERKGVNGVGIMRTGTRGKPLQYRSVVDVLNLDQAQALQTNYDSMIGLGRFDLVWDGVDYHAYHGIQYLVIDVEIKKIVYMSSMSGGLSGGTSGYIVEAMWTLVAVPASVSSTPSK